MMPEICQVPHLPDILPIHHRAPDLMIGDAFITFTEYTEAQREWMIQRRAFCLAQIPPPVLPEKIDIREISRAADKTLQQMGIACPSGEAFRGSGCKEPVHRFV